MMTLFCKAAAIALIFEGFGGQILAGEPPEEINTPFAIEGVDHRVMTSQGSLFVSGSGFSAVSRVEFVSGTMMPVQAGFTVVDDTTLKVPMDGLQITREFYLVVDSADESIACLKPGDSGVKILVAGETYHTGDQHERIIYACAGSVVELEGFRVGGTIFAEAGAIIDASSSAETHNVAFIYAKDAIVLGTLPVSPPDFGPQPRMVKSLSRSSSLGTFKVGNRINFGVIGDGRILTEPEGEYFATGDQVKLTAVAGDGAFFKSWSGSVISSDMTMQLRMGMDPLNIIATFAEGWTLSRHVSEGGTVSIDPNQSTFLKGESVTLTASPWEGYEFKGWGLDARGTAPEATFNMDGNKTISAVFRRVSGPSGPLISAADRYVAAVGAPVRFTGSGFTEISAAGFIGMMGYVPATFETLDAQSLELVMPALESAFRHSSLLLEAAAGSTVALDFDDSRVLVVENGQVAGGEEVNAYNEIYVRAGSLLRLPSMLTSSRIFAENGAIIDWSGVTFCDNTTFVVSPTTILLGDPVRLTSEGGYPNGGSGLWIREVISLSLSGPLPVFQLGQPIHFTVIGNGKVSSAPAGPFYAAFQSLNLTAEAESGSFFLGWSGGFVSPDANAQVVMGTEPISIVANFADGWLLEQYASGGGSILRSSDKNGYPDGEVVGLTAVSREGYEFVTWGGDASGSDPSATISMVRNKTVTAIFRKVMAPSGPSVHAADHFVMSEGGVITLSGLQLDEVDSATFLGTGDPVPTSFAAIGGESLQVTMPDFRFRFRPYLLLLEGKNGSVLTFDPTKADVLSVAPGQSTVLSELGNIRVVYVSAGGMLRLQGQVFGLSVFAEDGALVDWSGATGVDGSVFVYSPDSFVVGEPERFGTGGTLGSLNGLRIQQVAPLIRSSPMDHFQIGYPLTLAAMGPGIVSGTPERDYYPIGSSVTVTAVPDPGMHFIRWVGSTGNRNSEISLSFDGPLSVIGRFSAQSQTFSGWLLQHFSAAELADRAISGPSADPDGDQYSNAAEYAFFSDPRAASSSQSVQVSAETNPDDVDRPVHILVSYLRPSNAADVAYTVKVSDDGKVWRFNGDGSETRYSIERDVEDAGGGLDRVVIELFPDSAAPPSQLVVIDAQIF